MATNEQLPWASGPAEILRHGLSLLHEDSDTNRRLAMISIDNAVELMIKTYLGLPRRISGVAISRKTYGEFSESFPGLLDALERYAPEKLDGIDLGTIEWYHRLRNQLYHQGNGLTVERDKIEIYAELANFLFKNLYGRLLVDNVVEGTDLIGAFIEQWVSLEKGLWALAERERTRMALEESQPRTVLAAMSLLRSTNLFSDADFHEINRFRNMRNEVLHGSADHRTLITKEVIDRLRAFNKKIPDRAREEAQVFTEEQ